jgi:hypothetical protein
MLRAPVAIQFLSLATWPLVALAQIGCNRVAGSGDTPPPSRARKCRFPLPRADSSSPLPSLVRLWYRATGDKPGDRLFPA